MQSNARRFPLVLALAALLALSACGQTGPLVLPGSRPAAEQPAATSPADNEPEDEEQE